MLSHVARCIPGNLYTTESELEGKELTQRRVQMDPAQNLVSPAQLSTRRTKATHTTVSCLLGNPCMSPHLLQVRSTEQVQRLSEPCTNARIRGDGDDSSVVIVVDSSRHCGLRKPHNNLAITYPSCRRRKYCRVFPG